MARALLVTGAFIVWVEGPGLLAAYNLLPLLVIHRLARDLRQDAGGCWRRVGFHDLGALYGFAGTALAVTLYTHTAWSLNVNGAQTLAPGGAAVFVLVPIAALAIGLLGYLAGWLLARALTWGLGL